MGTSLRLLNILYTNHMPESVAFYEALGLYRRGDGEANSWWNEFLIGDAVLALHWNRNEPLPAGSNPELHLQANPDELDAIHRNLANYQPSPIESMDRVGRFFTVGDPNGVRVQINEQGQ